MKIVLKVNKQILVYSLFALIIMVFQTRAIAQVNKETTVIYMGQSLRDLAQETLGNPDYWNVILSYNNLDDITELESGTTLKIPTGLVAATLDEITTVQEKIGTAKKEGAKVLTPDLITKVETEFEKALILKQQGEWKDAFDSLQDVLKLATESLEQVRVLRESSADATLSFTKGDVQKRKPSEKLWSEAELYAKLYEADRARTMDDSFAEITFIDLSRIRLNENSQALIQHARVDVLKNKTETKVKLIKGDAFAYLLNSPKKKFDIDVPGLDAKIMSRSFWIEKETVSTKIANFDGEIELSAQDSIVVVKENQGSIIPAGGVPSKPQNLLTPPILTSPENLSKFYNNAITFIWEEVDNGERYWFELAKDAAFKNLITSNKFLRETEVSVNDLPAGVYYWHVASIDKQGFPGDFSRYNYLMIVDDESLPFLVVNSPKDNLVTIENKLLVSGETEKGVKISVNGLDASVENDGKFNTEIKLNNLINKIVISAVGENGKTFESIRKVYYESSPNVENEITSENYNSSQKEFTVNSNKLDFSGKTRPLSNISVLSSGREFRTFADSLGNYSISAEIGSSEKISLAIATPAGYTKSDEYVIMLDNSPPELVVETKLPKYTNQTNIVIEGNVKGAKSLLINSLPVSLDENKFIKSLSLSEAENIINIQAIDDAGNIAEQNYTIRKDSKPPELVDWSVEKIKNGEFLVIVKASDEYGLKKTALAKIEIDGSAQELVLVYNSSKGEYSKVIYLSDDVRNIKLKTVELNDYLENSKEYQIK